MRIIDDAFLLLLLSLPSSPAPLPHLRERAARICIRRTIPSGTPPANDCRLLCRKRGGGTVTVCRQAHLLDLLRLAVCVNKPDGLLTADLRSGPLRCCCAFLQIVLMTSIFNIIVYRSDPLGSSLAEYCGVDMRGIVQEIRRQRLPAGFNSRQGEKETLQSQQRKMLKRSADAVNALRRRRRSAYVQIVRNDSRPSLSRVGWLSVDSEPLEDADVGQQGSGRVSQEAAGGWGGWGGYDTALAVLCAALFFLLMLGAGFLCRTYLLGQHRLSDFGEAASKYFPKKRTDSALCLKQEAGLLPAHSPVVPQHVQPANGDKPEYYAWSIGSPRAPPSSPPCTTKGVASGSTQTSGSQTSLLLPPMPRRLPTKSVSFTHDLEKAPCSSPVPSSATAQAGSGVQTLGSPSSHFPVQSVSSSDAVVVLTSPASSSDSSDDYEHPSTHRRFLNRLRSQVLHVPQAPPSSLPPDTLRTHRRTKSLRDGSLVDVDVKVPETPKRRATLLDIAQSACKGH